MATKKAERGSYVTCIGRLDSQDQCGKASTRKLVSYRIYTEDQDA